MGSRLYAVGITVAASFGLPLAAAAETTASALSVGATVESSCLVSSQNRVTAGRPASLSCSHLAEGTVSVERGRTTPHRSPPTSRLATPTPISSTKNEVTFVTITY